eukprot:391596_1
MATVFRRNLILEQINASTSTHDLIPMLHAIELASLQNILKQKVKEMDVTDISTLFCSSLSIENILPVDIIGHITSFYNMSQVQAVSKTFNACYQQNKKTEIQEREKHIASKLKSNDNCITTTYVVDPTRTELNANEIRLKYNGPMHDLLDAINVANDGDTILLGDGTYGLYDEYVDEADDNASQFLFTINKRLCIIGIGNNVLIQYNRMHVLNHIYLKDVRIKTVSEITVFSECELFMQHCTVDIFTSGIDMLDGCAVHINDCTFYGSECSYWALSIHEEAKSVGVSHCVFNGFGRSECLPSIVVASDRRYGHDLSRVDLTFIDNKFSNNEGVLIAKHDSYSFRVSSKAIFEGNHRYFNRDNAALDIFEHFMYYV